ncbi:hypothetical protein, partial [Stenotrophomonas maltophilia]|uniref:hypothetical protein n=1 Tax=Stenotrophomonas maltophilia TaxID=40324 RepID=UPI001954CA0B
MIGDRDADETRATRDHDRHSAAPVSIAVPPGRPTLPLARLASRAAEQKREPVIPGLPVRAGWLACA